MSAEFRRRLRHSETTVRSLCTAAFLALLIGLLGCGPGHRAAVRAPAQTGGEAFVFSSEDSASTQYWLADPAKPSVRRLITSVPHAPGRPGNAAVSPNGRRLAYTLLPAGGRDPDHEGVLMTLNLADGSAQAVARGIDLRSTVVWTENSSAVSFQRFDSGGEELWLQPAAGGTGEIVAEATADERLLPIAGEPEAGRLLVARYGAGGVDLVEAGAGARPTPVQHLTDGVARNLVLNGAGNELAFVATSATTSAPETRGYVVPPHGGALQELPAEWGEIVGVAWSPTGALVAGAAGLAPGLHNLNGGNLTAPFPPGFGQPLAWSPSARYLAVRLFSGTSAEQPGSARDVLLSSDGKVASITDSLPVRFVGWVAQG